MTFMTKHLNKETVNIYHFLHIIDLDVPVPSHHSYS